MSLSECKLVELPKIVDPRGNLTFIESERHIHFIIKRVYYLYDVPGGAERGGHGHKELEQLIVALSGSLRPRPPCAAAVASAPMPLSFQEFVSADGR